MLILLSVVLFPIFFGISIAKDTPAPLLLPLTIFLGGLAWILYSYAFKDDVAPPPVNFQPQFNQNPQWGLPNPQSYSVENFNQDRLKTGEMVPPTSVTESTTTLFEKE